MRKGFYVKIAWNNIKKNFRFFVPRILSEMGLLACFYIALTLAMDGRLAEIKGGEYVPTFMWIGCAVLAILSTILMFYTNSFMMKQRKHEYGLYNILGMEKKHVGKVLFHETFLCSIVAIIGGLLFGMLFYKLCSLLICRLLGSEIVLGFYFINIATITLAGLFFLVLDIVTFIFNCIGIAFMKPIELLKSRETGEKEPKIKFLMFIIGLATLGAGYYISITTTNPLAAIGLFFVAVLLVIVGTYFLFVSGSIFVLKVLRNNEKYYYKSKHMPSISGLLYRMKQNAVGLASIAILATGVLVMMSTTVSLYSGIDGTLKREYPQHLYVAASYGEEVVPCEILEDSVKKAAEKNDVEIKSIEHNNYLQVAYMYNEGEFIANKEKEFVASYENVCDCLFITAETYNGLLNEKLELKKDEIAVNRMALSTTGVDELDETVTIMGKQYKIVTYLNSFPINAPLMISGYAVYGIVVSDQEVLDEIYEAQKNDYGESASEYTTRIAVTYKNLEKASEVGKEMVKEIYYEIYDRMLEKTGEDTFVSYIEKSYWDAKETSVGMFGALLFLGIILGGVCLFATLLIIYYKQISEGYEDRDRFQIMEKIGMSRKEVRKTINSQVLLVFFLPLIVAGVHMGFAYPMLIRMLRVLMLYKDSLFLICTLITYAVFALVYSFIFKVTSKTYYKIVH